MSARSGSSVLGNAVRINEETKSSSSLAVPKSVMMKRMYEKRKSLQPRTKTPAKDQAWQLPQQAVLYKSREVLPS